MASRLDRRTLLLAAALVISIAALGFSLLAIAQQAGFRVVQNVPLAGAFAGFVAQDPQVRIVDFRVCRNDLQVDRDGNIIVRSFAFNLRNQHNEQRKVVAMVNVYDAQGNLVASGAKRDIQVPGNQEVSVVVELNQGVHLNRVARAVGIVQIPAADG